MNRRMEERSSETGTPAEGSAGGTEMNEQNTPLAKQGMANETTEEQLTEAQRTVRVPLPLDERACTHLQRHGCRITLCTTSACITFPEGTSRTWLCAPASMITGDRFLWTLPDGSHVYQRELRHRADDCVLLLLPAREVQTDER